MKNDLISVQLDRVSWGQLLDGLSCRLEQYEMTAQYHREGEADGEVIEVTDAEEAESIADDYRAIINMIRTQVNG